MPRLRWFIRSRISTRSEPDRIGARPDARNEAISAAILGCHRSVAARRKSCEIPWQRRRRLLRASLVNRSGPHDRA
jgi:hypothetical protein